MRIALIAAINNPIKMPFEGGVPTQVWWTTKKLVERGHDVTLFASGDSDQELPLLPIIDKSLFTKTAFRHADGKRFIDKVNRKLRSLTSLKTYKKLRSYLSEQGRFDIIHNHALFETPLLDAPLYAAPMVTTLHTPPFREITKGVKMAGAQKSSHFVSVSKSLAKVWEDYTPSTVIYNGVNIQDWTFQSSPDPKTAIWFGRITPQKAPHLAIQAAIKAGYKLDLYGKIVDRSYYDSEIAPLLATNDLINYGGSLSHAELAKKIGQAAVMINTPQWEEPFGLTFVEAMACGTPIATFESGAASEIITDKTGVIVPKNDINALATAIDKAAALKRAECHQHAEQNFSIDRMIDAYEKLYQGIVQKTA